MIKHFLMAAGAIVLAGAGYTAVLAADAGSGSAAVAASAPATETSAAVDVKNTKCMVTKEAVEGEDQTKVEYKGKIYHLCCSMCIKKFNRDPDSFVKALEADPAAYSVKK